MKFSSIIFLGAVAAIRTRDEPAQFNVEVKSFGNNPNNACKAGDTASVNYTGKLTNGEVFDSSKGDPLQFTIGASQVIKCWDMAFAQMQQGETATVTCPSNVAYGDQSPSPKIPAGSTLIFDVEVMNCESGY